MFNFNFFHTIFIILLVGGDLLGALCQSNETTTELDTFASSLLWFSFQNWNYTGPEHTVDGNYTKCPKSTGVIRCNEAGELTGVVLSGANLNGAHLETESTVFFLRTVSSLQVLKFDSTGLAGTIPHQALGDLHRLHTLWLNDNELVGEIPSELFFDPERQFPLQLQSLRLHNNQLQGSLPDTVAQSVNLTELTVYHNHLRGVIPAGLSASTALEVCELVANATEVSNKGNCFLCPLPADLPPACGSASNSPPDRRLTECQTSCGAVITAPTAPPSPATRSPTAVPTPAPPTAPTPVPVGPVYLDTNHATLLRLLLERWNVTMSSLQLPGNNTASTNTLYDVTCPQDSGPVLCNSQGQLTGVQLSGTPLTGELEKVEDPQRQFTLRAIPSLHTLRLDRTGLSGTLPKKALGDLHQLHTLWLNDNQLTGPVPADLFYDEGRSKVIEIKSLRLQNNLLEGVLPADAIALAPSLTEFFVYGNRLRGQLPDGLSAQLSSCDLGGRRRSIGSATGNCFQCPVPASLPSACNASAITCNWCVPPPTPAPTYPFRSPAPTPFTVPQPFDFFPVLMGLFGGVCITGLAVTGAVCFVIRRRRPANPNKNNNVAMHSDIGSLYGGKNSGSRVHSRSRSGSRASTQTGRDFTSVTSAGPRRRSASKSGSRSRHASVSGGLRHPAYASVAVAQSLEASSPNYDSVGQAMSSGHTSGTADELMRNKNTTAFSTSSSIYTPGPTLAQSTGTDNYDSVADSVYTDVPLSRVDGEGGEDRDSNYTAGSNYFVGPATDSDGYAASHLLIHRLMESDQQAASEYALAPAPGHMPSEQGSSRFQEDSRQSQINF